MSPVWQVLHVKVTYDGHKMCVQLISEGQNLKINADDEKRWSDFLLLYCKTSSVDCSHFISGPSLYSVTECAQQTVFDQRRCSGFSFSFWSDYLKLTKVWFTQTVTLQNLFNIHLQDPISILVPVKSSKQQRIDLRIIICVKKLLKK